MLKVVEKKKIWFSISAIIIAIGLIAMFAKGLNFGIDF
ncbi:MAG: protein translocase subunit SecF, partial [Clostridium paraputrificum]